MNSNIRNFVIIAHIDHGKSTLADRFLELTKTVSENKLKPQYLDRMDLEKEHGITIKMHPVRMLWHSQTQNSKLKTQNLKGEYILNLIDTPGHVDFTYEVSRALAAVEGAVLLVDGTQGIQAQTISNFILAQKQGLKIIGAINKIDLEIPDLEQKRKELADLLKVDGKEIILLSAKTGKNVDTLLQKIAVEIPGPEIKKESPFRALVFDSHYDDYKGIIAYLRVVEGEIAKGEKIHFVISGAKGSAVDLGYFAPELKSKDKLKSGEIGWIATGLKDLNLVRVGDTITKSPIIVPLPGYKEPKPVVFAGFYLAKGKIDSGLAKSDKDFEHFRQSLNQLKLNDSALYFTPESSEVLGRGYRLGFLGMLHLKITQERLKKEYGLDLVITQPTAPYKVLLKGGKEKIITNPSEWPSPNEIIGYEEPWVNMEIITMPQYLSRVMKLVNDCRGENMNTFTFVERLAIKCEIPLEEVIKDFYDNLKSVSSGYASLSYEISGYKPTELEKLEVILAGKQFESLSRIVFRDKIEKEARKLALKLKDVLPRQNYAIPIQIKGMGRIIARETVPALKKDVTGYLYGGDRTRKMKLWKKQAKGKKKLLQEADLQIPSEVFLKIFSSSR
ncbi:MAG: translation elongation factor 4 [Candidatus Pacebacteria bacterium]|nr:translation elongation factor 4 [Candidatus Paceibacterota bacterium]